MSLIVGLAAVSAAPPLRLATQPAAQPLTGQNPTGDVSIFPRSGSGDMTMSGENGTALLASVIQPKKTPSRVNASGSMIYGNLIANQATDVPTGLTEVLTDGTFSQLFATPGPWGGTLAFTGMYIRDGKIYAIAEEGSGMIKYNTWVLIYDMEGKRLSNTAYGADDELYNYFAYDSKRDMLYGYVETNDGIFFATAPGASPNKLTRVAELDGKPVCAMTYNQVTDRVIGVCSSNNGGNIVEISKFDGSQKVIGKLADVSDYITAICYSPVDNAYVYGYCTQAKCSIQLLDSNDFSVISSKDYNGIVEFGQFYCDDTRKVSDNAPGEAEFVGANFPKGALSGKLSFRLPSVNCGGVPLLGNVDWVLEIDGTPVARGSGAAGSVISPSVTVETTGIHSYSLKTSLGGAYGPYLNDDIYIGNDTPVAPEKVTLTDQMVSWTPVTTGIHGGYVDPSAVTYNVYLNDKLIVEGISDTSCPCGIPQDQEMTFYEAFVEAVFDGRISARTGSNDLPYGDPYAIPVSFEPSQQQSKIFTVYDANKDNRTIEFSASFFQGTGDVNGFMYKAGTRQADDWLFLPAVNFADGSAVYEFSLNIFRILPNYTETFEVALSTQPDPDHIVKTLIPSTNLTNVRPQDVNATVNNAWKQYYRPLFSVPSAGVYYIGVHITSPRNAFNVFMHDFSIRKMDGVSGASPLGATNLTATADAGGKLEATVMCVLPTATIDGNVFGSDKTLSATIQAEGCEAVTVSGAPGMPVRAVVPTKQGDNVISAVVKDGDLTSVVETVNVYTGVEIPGTVTNLKATVDKSDYVMHLTWDAPAQGANGGYVAPTDIKYFLCEYLTVEGAAGWYATEEIGTDVFEYDYRIPEGTPQNIFNVGIVCANFVGTATRLASTNALMGEPVATPATCNYSAGEALTPIVNYTPSGATLNTYLDNPALRYSSFTTPDNAKALFTYCSSTRVAQGSYGIPKFSTKGAFNPAIKLSTYGGSTSSFSVLVGSYDVEETVVKTFTSADFAQTGRQDVVVELGEQFADKDWVSIRFVFNMSRTESFIVYGYKVYDNVPFDFGVTSITGPDVAAIGEVNTYTAHVVNFGSDANAMPASSWKLTDSEGNVVADVNVAAGTANIAPDDELTLDLAFTPTADQLGDYTLTYTIEKADNKETNDSMTRSFSVLKGLKPVITDLHATDIGFDNVTLAWSPLTVSSDRVESFEDETPLVFDSESATLAEFKRYDGDGKIVYGIQNDGYTGLGIAGTPQSFVVWSADEMNKAMGTNYKAYEGDKFIVAICPQPENGEAPAADDWLISPAVEGGTEISFAIRPFTYNYGAEVVEIMYSESTDEIADFKVLKTIEITGSGNNPVWEDKSFTLPKNAKYFAIHYVSKDIFGIMLDDIRFVPEGSVLGIKGFNIYRDGMQIATEDPCADSTYTDATVEADSEYTYVVVPVLSDGTQCPESNTLVIRTTGADMIVVDDADAIYYNMQGILVIGKPEPGVYLRKKGDRIEKVIVK